MLYKVGNPIDIFIFISGTSWNPESQ